MKIRKTYGTANLVGTNIETLRKTKNISQKEFIENLHKHKLDINPTSYSKLEGQTRSATDKEIYAIAKVLDVSVDSLFTQHI